MVELITLILFFFALYTIVSLSLNLEFGYGGIPNFGKALSVLTGAVVVGGIIWYFGVGGDFISASSVASYQMTEIICQNPIVGLGVFIFCVLLAVILGAIVGALSILPRLNLGGTI